MEHPHFQYIFIPGPLFIARLVCGVYLFGGYTTVLTIDSVNCRDLACGFEYGTQGPKIWTVWWWIFWGQDSIGYEACYKGCEYGDSDKRKVCIVKFVFLGGGA